MSLIFAWSIFLRRYFKWTPHRLFFPGKLLWEDFFPQRSWSFRPLYLCLTQHVIKIPVVGSFVKKRQAHTKMLTGSQVHKEKLYNCLAENTQYWIYAVKKMTPLQHLVSYYLLVTFLGGVFQKEKDVSRLHEALPAWPSQTSLSKMYIINGIILEVFIAALQYSSYNY